MTTPTTTTTPATLRAGQLLACALTLGVAADLLLKPMPWRLGFVLWVVLAVGVALVFARGGAAPSRDRALLLSAIAVAASALILRDAPMLQAITIVSTLTFAALAAWSARGRALSAVRISDVPLAWGHAALSAGVGAPLLAFNDAELESKVAGAPPDRRRVRLAALGVLIAIPPVVVVAALLAEADPVFGRFVTLWQELPFENAVEHAITIGVFAWPVAGWLRSLIRPIRVPEALEDIETLRPRVDFAVVAPLLYMLAALLAVYLGLQARALFGGAAYVEATSGLTYAEYARRGFFELVAVTALVLALLLAGDWVLDRREGDASRRFRAAGWLLLGLLAVLVVSAVQRMSLYVDFFGLSVDRLYALAGMTWIAVALAWFGWTVLRDARGRFGFGLLIWSAIWLATLQLINPESLVVRTNVARAVAGKSFDVAYHATLSADAVPALVDAAERRVFEPAICGTLITQLHARWRSSLEDEHATDWRLWSAPRARMRARLNVPLETLLSRTCAGAG